MVEGDERVKRGKRESERNSVSEWVAEWAE